MKNLKNMIIQIGLETLCFIGIGLLFLGFVILDPHNTGFSFTIFGLSEILFYQILVNSNTKSFILGGILFSLLMIILFQTNYEYDIVIYIRNFCWFPSIGIMVYFLALVGKKGWYKESKLWILTSWFIGFILVYVVMSLVNIYVFDFYKTSQQVTAFFYLNLAIKMGGILGIGIGLGSLIGSFIVKNKIIQAEV